jgi:hypothetical protein
MRRLCLVFIFSVAMGNAMAISYGVGNNVVYASSYQNFKAKFCSISPTREKIFVLPAVLFKNYQSMTCHAGVYRLRVNEPSEDMGHYVYNIDPPANVNNAFDCDGKADIGMKFIAINCYPVRKESASHSRRR